MPGLYCPSAPKENITKITARKGAKYLSRRPFLRFGFISFYFNLVKFYLASGIIKPKWVPVPAKYIFRYAYCRFIESDPRYSSLIYSSGWIFIFNSGWL